jgi:hypothetical protein
MPAEMAASYTDEHARPDDFSRLCRLKERLEREFPNCVRRYRPAWESSRHRVVGRCPISSGLMARRPTSMLPSARWLNASPKHAG